MHKHPAGRTIEENDDLTSDRCRAGDVLVSQCVGEPSLEPLLVGGTCLDCGMSRRTGKLGRGSHEAAALPAWPRRDVRSCNDGRCAQVRSLYYWMNSRHASSGQMS